MALDAMNSTQHPDIYAEIEKLRSRSTLSRQLIREHANARKEEQNRFFTPRGVRQGGWGGYLSRLLVTLFVCVAIGWLFAAIPFSGELVSGSSALQIEVLDKFSASQHTFTRVLIIGAVVIGYLATSLKTLRRRGWLLTATPLGAILSLYVYF